MTFRVWCYALNSHSDNYRIKRDELFIETIAKFSSRRVYKRSVIHLIHLKNVVQNDVPCLVHDAIAYAPYALNSHSDNYRIKRDELFIETIAKFRCSAKSQFQKNSRTIRYQIQTVQFMVIQTQKCCSWNRSISQNGTLCPQCQRSQNRI